MELLVAYQDADSPAVQDTIKRARAALDQSSPPKAIEREGYPKDAFINDYD